MFVPDCLAAGALLYLVSDPLSDQAFADGVEGELGYCPEVILYPAQVATLLVVAGIA